MYNPAFEDELYNDRNQSFRKAVRAPKKNQRCFANGGDVNDFEDTSTSNNVGYLNKKTTTSWTKYNWKRFLPWAPRAKGYVSGTPGTVLFTCYLLESLNI